MFTGLVTAIGTVRKAEHRNGLTRFEVEGDYPVASIEMGASIMHSGVCLTVVDFGAVSDARSWWAVEAIPETLDKSVLGAWQAGTRTNLEQSLKLGDEMGGHIVSGHVDGVGEIVSIDAEGESFRITVRPPRDMTRHITRWPNGDAEALTLSVYGNNLANPINMARHNMPAHFIAKLQALLQIGARPGLPRAKHGLVQCFRYRFDSPP